MNEILDIIKKYDPEFKIVDTITIHEDYAEIVVKEFVSIEELDNIRKIVEEVKETLGDNATASIYIGSIIIEFWGDVT